MKRTLEGRIAFGINVKGKGRATEADSLRMSICYRQTAHREIR